MAAQRTLMTADELLRLPDDHMRHELVKGELRTMPPAGVEHGFVEGELFAVVREYVRSHELGFTFGAETGFRISRNPDTVRAPDVAFVAKGRLPGDRPPPTFPDLAPDVVAEVVSPSNTATEVREKVQEWLEAGVRLVWVVWPSNRSVTEYRSPAEVRELAGGDQLDGFDVLPGFTCPVRDIFG
jgi:Uma2 family endonuclease